MCVDSSIRFVVSRERKICDCAVLDEEEEKKVVLMGEFGAVRDLVERAHESKALPPSAPQACLPFIFF